MGRQPAARVEQNAAFAKYREGVAQQFRHRSRTKLTDKVNEVGLLHLADLLGELFSGDVGQQVRPPWKASGSTQQISETGS